jgi:copper chaperone CopZ
LETNLRDAFEKLLKEKKMKTTSSILVLSLTLLLSASGMAQEKKTATLIIQTSAKCGMCKTRIENDLKFEKGVKSVILDNASKKVSVVYRIDKTNPERIKTAITKIGYDADEMPANIKAHDRLPKCCQKTAEPH